MKNWKRIKEHPRYLISTDGQIMNSLTHRILKTTKNKDGYITVTLPATEINKRTPLRVHRLIATAFIPPFGGEGMVVDHMNRVRDDNRIANLRWVNKAGNNDNKEKTHPCICACGYSVTKVFEIGG